MQPVHDEPPQEMIRAIRQALGLTRAEFGRALGWAPSTIARWESGRAQPNRLAVKIILAFAEERRVRYRPRRELVLRTPVPAPSVPALTVQGPESSGSIGASMPSASPPALVLGPPASDAWVASARAKRPRWEAALSLRVALDRRDHVAPSRHTWLRKACVGAAAVGAVLLIGMPMSRRPSAPSHARDELIPSAAPPVAAPAPEPDAQPAVAALVSTPAASAAPAPAPTTATLEGVTLLGDVRLAMFRTPTETITLTEGTQLGERQATRIGAEGVELREPTGRLRMVRIGGRVPID